MGDDELRLPVTERRDQAVGEFAGIAAVAIEEQDDLGASGARFFNPGQAGASVAAARLRYDDGSLRLRLRDRVVSAAAIDDEDGA